MAVLDTNVIIRYLTKDNADHARQAYELLQEVDAGKRTMLLPEGVLVEIVQVLSSKQLYNVARGTIRERLRAILSMPGIRLPNKRSYLQALDLYVDYSRLSFVDALCIAHAQRSEGGVVVSFDEGYKNLPGVKWEQP